MDSVMSANAITGTGFQPGTVNKALDDYSSRNSQIQNYIDSLKCCGNCDNEDICYGDNECPHYGDCSRTYKIPANHTDYWKKKLD